MSQNRTKVSYIIKQISSINLKKKSGKIIILQRSYTVPRKILVSLLKIYPS